MKLQLMYVVKCSIDRLWKKTLEDIVGLVAQRAHTPTKTSCRLVNTAKQSDWAIQYKYVIRSRQDTYTNC